jgi:hypothetical protein
MTAVTGKTKIGYNKAERLHSGIGYKS